MGFNKNTWDKDYTGAPGLKKLGKLDKQKGQKKDDEDR